MRLDPLPVHVPNDGLGSRSDNQRFFEFGGGIGLDAFLSILQLAASKAVMGHNRALFGKAFHVFGFFGEKGEGDEQGEVGVHMACGFEAFVEVVLHRFPNGEAMGTKDH